MLGQGSRHASFLLNVFLEKRLAFCLGPKEVVDDTLAFVGKPEGIGGIFRLGPSDKVVVDVPEGRIHWFTISNNSVG